MYEKQHTIKGTVSVAGIGLHTGVPAKLTFHPAPENHGYVFRRTDLEGKPEVKADVDHVIDTARGTTIEANGARVHTVEHCLAALVGLQIDNCLIEIDGPEPPVMDGSSVTFLKALAETGLTEQDADRNFFEVSQPIHYRDEERGTEMSITPNPEYRVEVMVDYNSEVLGTSTAAMEKIEDFSDQISDSRTFCFLHELEMLYAAGLIQGGNLDNAIVLVEKEISTEQKEKLAGIFGKQDIAVNQGVLNNLDLRHENEPARHKLLDVVGDLALVGRPIKGQIKATRPGHPTNVALGKKIKAAMKVQELQKKYGMTPKDGVIFDINAIEKILPHRYPFLLVDKITGFEEKWIEGVKNVTMNEQFFQGHFPGNPVMPGVLQLEAMAQVGGIMLINTVDNPDDYWVYFMTIDNAKFRKPVIPGDTLVFQLELLQQKRNICKMHGKGYVEGKVVVQADLTAAMVKKDA